MIRDPSKQNGFQVSKISRTKIEMDCNRKWLAELDRRMRVTPAMLHSIDHEGRLIFVSDAWLARLGYVREEVIGKRSSEFLTPESRAHAVSEVLPTFFRTGRCDDVHYQMVCKDGRVIDVLLSAVLDRSSSELEPVSRAVITDVTTLKATKRQLAASESRYRELVESQSELVSLATPDGELRFVNNAYARHYGRQPEDMVGRSLFDFIPEEGRAAVIEHLRNVCSADRGIEAENQVVLPNGQTRWIGWTNRALTDADGRVTGIHSVGRDIHERVMAEGRLQESEARYRLLAENSTDMILLVDQSGRRLYASPACRALLGYEPEEMLQIRTRESIHPDDLGFLEVRRTFGDNEAATFRYRMHHKNGDYIWVESISRTVKSETGQLVQRLVVVRNIEERIATEQRLKESEARYRLLADHSTDMVFQLDHNLVRQYVSPACREILGYEPEELVGIKPIAMVHPEDAPYVTLTFQSLLNGSVDRHSILNRFRHRNGHWIWVEAQLKALKSEETGKPEGILGTLRDVSARKAVEDQLQEANRRLQALAEQDGLTGLSNRRFFDNALLLEHRRVRRDKKNLALLMIDVDWFKAFNDLYGHPAGDDCLKRLAETIKTAAWRPGDVAARYGGEEFSVLLPDADEAEAAIVAERIREAVVNLAIEHGGSPNRIATVSVGAVSMSWGALDESEALLQQADRALYCAKHGGRNTVFCGSSLSSASDFKANEPQKLTRSSGTSVT